MLNEFKFQINATFVKLGLEDEEDIDLFNSDTGEGSNEGEEEGEEEVYLSLHKERQKCNLSLSLCLSSLFFSTISLNHLHVNIISLNF